MVQIYDSIENLHYICIKTKNVFAYDSKGVGKFNNGEKSTVSFWRDSKGNEVDLIETDSERKKAIEIKSGKTFSADYFKGLRKWQELSQTPPDDSCVVYAGDVPRITQYGKLVPFANLNNED